ncbi:MAG: preQ(1) synthase [Spirochaetota bacterium]
MADANKSSYEGLQSNIPKLETPPIEVFENVYVGNDFLVEFRIPEFTAICPKTGLPDFGTIEISYMPNQVCVELKSLKEYVLFFRTIGIFHENVVNRFLDDLVKAIQPKYLRVHGDFSVRGGIKTNVTREWGSR